MLASMLLLLVEQPVLVCMQPTYQYKHLRGACRPLLSYAAEAEGNLGIMGVAGKYTRGGRRIGSNSTLLSVPIG